MSAIGDLVMRLVVDAKGFSTDIERQAQKAGTQASQSFVGKFKGGLKGAFSASKGALLGGLGLGAGLGAVGLATEGVSRLTQVMGDAVQAAIEEEASIAKLDAALRANVEGYNGNTDAIEKTLAARMRLGFADDEQRESLALLVAATKDETKALEIQRAAMDLARFKRISLKEASEALIKVEAGQFRILKSLGIQLREGATAEEALTEVRRLAAGQAEAYAETNEGKLLASQIRVGEAMELLGARALPLVAGATEEAAEAVVTLVAGFEALGDTLDILTTGQMPETEDEAVALVDAILGLAQSIPIAGESVRPLREQLKLLADEELRAERVTHHMKDALKDDNAAAAASFEPIADEAGDTARAVDRAAAKIRRDVDDMVTDLIAGAERLIGEFFDPIETRADIYQARLDQNAAEEAARDAKTAADKREATDDILSSIRRQADGLVDLGKQGELTEKDIATFEKNVKKSYDVLGKKVPPDIRKIIRELRELDKFDGHHVNVSVNVVGDSMLGRNKSVRPGSGRAAGGPVSAGTPYWVGERGPEIFVPSDRGYVMPHAPSMALAAAADGGSTINLEVHGLPMQVETPLDVARELRRATDLGVVPRRARPRRFRR